MSFDAARAADAAGRADGPQRGRVSRWRTVRRDRGGGGGGAGGAGSGGRGRSASGLQDRGDRVADAGISRAERAGRRVHGDGGLARLGRGAAVRRVREPGGGVRGGGAAGPRSAAGAVHAGAAPGRRWARSWPGSRSWRTGTGSLKAVGTPLLVADQMFHGAGIIGAPGSPGVDLGALKGRILIDGVERDAGVSTDLLGHPLNCLAWLAGSSVAAAFGGLRAGQVIMLGSVVPVIWMASPWVGRGRVRGAGAGGVNPDLTGSGVPARKVNAAKRARASEAPEWMRSGTRFPRNSN